eukprot:TRINITY_DN18718_c0_g1_i1.p1 TRINITY_DN18718_c0_g1~~TRINITY_DN18718_c0_g1_i1.p1  ORF type:complete len:374 (+),score=114.42 TRINITY_DN18718_c0_g1_i1:93-1124(+)
MVLRTLALGLPLLAGTSEAVTLAKDAASQAADGDSKTQAVTWDDRDILGKQHLEGYFDPEFDGVKVNHRCRDMYNKAMKEIFLESQAGHQGSTLVLGANDGKSFDPATEMFDFWHKVPNFRKVFVEPVPPLFAKLQENMKMYENVHLVNKAMRVGEKAEAELKLFCWDMDVVDRAVQHGERTLPSELRQPQEYWKALCSFDRSSVLDRSNVYDEAFFKLNETHRARVKEEVERHILPYSVQALSPGELIDQYDLQDLKYLQIDVEGLDDLIVKNLPFGKETFKPKVILHEWEGSHPGDEIPKLFDKNGYDWCATFWHQGHNAVAVLRDSERAAPKSIVRKEQN